MMIADVDKLCDTNIWDKLMPLGRGGFGEVFKYEHIPTRKFVAVKGVKFDPSEANVDSKRLTLRREVKMYSEFFKPKMQNEIESGIKSYRERIVEYFGSIDDEANCLVLICLEYMQRGSVRDFLNHTKQPLSVEKTQKYTRQVLEGLCFLHSKAIHVVHRDIKAGNILITDDDNIKLVDFGASKYLDSSSQGAKTQNVGTYNWMAPEVVNGEKYGLKADIWSVGCTVVEMLTMTPPWSGLTKVTIINKLEAGTYPEYVLPSPSEDLQKFLKLCFQKEHRERPSAVDLLKTNFVKDCTRPCS